jgi:DNA-binding GntR family transcriptional regulator
MATWENLAPELRMKACVKLNVDKLEAAAHEHLDIVEAFAEGDNRFAAKLLKKHAETIITRLHEKGVNVKEAIV